MNDGMLQRQSKTTTIDEMCRLSNSYRAADVFKMNRTIIDSRISFPIPFIPS